MGNLLTSLLNSTGAFHAYDRALSVIQNNIVNANTPGYVRQTQTLEAQPFEPQLSLPGGVLAGPVISARSEFLEQQVRQQQENFGQAQQQAADLRHVEPLFTLTGTSGLSSAMDQFFGSFSALSVNPNDASARHSVLDQASLLVDRFHSLTLGISQVAGNVDRQTSDNVAAINSMAAQVAQLNQQITAGVDQASDAGLDAQMHATLEELSGLANVTVLKEQNGAFTVCLGGQSLLVLGNRSFAVSADLSGPATVIRDSAGNDATASISRSQLGALIEDKNVKLPGYQTDINALAAAFADQVNAQLAQGLDRNGVTPAINLLQYAHAQDAAQSIAVTSITADQIAAASSSSPGGNGNAIAVARLAQQPLVGGATFTDFFANLSARVGRDTAAANRNQSQYKDQLAQARDQRATLTGVSLDEEAAKLIQFQQAYQATGKLVGVLDTLTQTLMNLIH